MAALDDRINRLYDGEGRVAELERRMDALNKEGGGGTSGGMSDDWKISVDKRLDQLHTDVRSLLSKGVIAVVALASMISGLYFYVNEKTAKIDDDIGALKLDVRDLRSEARVNNAITNGKIDILIERSGGKNDASPK